MVCFLVFFFSSAQLSHLASSEPRAVKLRNVLLTSKRAELCRHSGPRQRGESAAAVQQSTMSAGQALPMSAGQAAADTGICSQSPRVRPEPGRACVRARLGRCAPLPRAAGRDAARLPVKHPCARESLWKSWRCQADSLTAGCLGFVVFLSIWGDHAATPIRCISD